MYDHSVGEFYDVNMPGVFATLEPFRPMTNIGHCLTDFTSIPHEGVTALGDQKFALGRVREPLDGCRAMSGRVGGPEGLDDTGRVGVRDIGTGQRSGEKPPIPE
jgi:hypothetical protein